VQHQQHAGDGEQRRAVDSADRHGGRAHRQQGVDLPGAEVFPELEEGAARPGSWRAGTCSTGGRPRSSPRRRRPLGGSVDRCRASAVPPAPGGASTPAAASLPDTRTASDLPRKPP
jgi:hypothetical protein